MNKITMTNIKNIFLKIKFLLLVFCLHLMLACILKWLKFTSVEMEILNQKRKLALDEINWYIKISRSIDIFASTKFTSSHELSLIKVLQESAVHANSGYNLCQWSGQLVRLYNLSSKEKKINSASELKP